MLVACWSELRYKKLTTDEDKAKSEDTCGVICVEPSEEQESKDVVVTIGEVGAEICKKLLSVDNFASIQNRLQVLENQTSARGFCRTLDGLMRGYGFTFSITGAPKTSTPVANHVSGRPKFIPAIADFQDQVEVMRNLHPQLSSVDHTTHLDTHLPTWRRAAAAAMGMSPDEYRRFGGNFREAIRVACFSKRCYAEVKTIFQEMIMTRQKINASLFGTCPGHSNEPAMFMLLSRMAKGEFSRNEFRRRVEEDKKLHQNTVASSWKQKAEDLERENGNLRKHIRLLELRLENNQALSQPCPQEVEPRDVEIIEPQEVEEYVHNDTQDVVAIRASQDIATVDFTTHHDQYQFQESDISPPAPRKPRARKASYKLDYKPRSDSSEELYDSDKDREWKKRKHEKSSTDQSDESEFNEAFVESPTVSPRKVFEAEHQLEDDDATFSGHQTSILKITLHSKADSNGEAARVTSGQGTVSRRTREQHKPAKMFKPGDKALGLFINEDKKDKWEEWFDCVVLANLMNGEMYRVRFCDGMRAILKKDRIKEVE